MHQIRHCMIDGDLSLNYRKKVLKEFRAADGANVLLMTLGTGAVGYLRLLSVSFEVYNSPFTD
jgi:SNF2 family DNA or RNA helicase